MRNENSTSFFMLINNINIIVNMHLVQVYKRTCLFVHLLVNQCRLENSL